MTRSSRDEHDSKGILKNGFDYDLQVWVIDYIIQNCGHPANMDCGCLGREYQGMRIDSVDLIGKR